MCTHGTSVPMPIGERVRDIDACLAPIIAALNAGGVPTLACCCGHGKIPPSIILDDGACGAEDGRWIIILPRAEAEAYYERAEELTRLRAVFASAELGSGNAEHVLLYVRMPTAEYEALKGHA